MEWLKKHFKEIIIVLLVLFGLNKCTQSCSRGTELENAKTEIITNKHSSDSVIQVLNDSINQLNIRIQVYEEKISGLNQAISIQDEANKRISEAKKNINVNVKQQK